MAASTLLPRTRHDPSEVRRLQRDRRACRKAAPSSSRLTNVDPIGLDKDQRAWLFDLVDLFHQYQAEDETNVLFGP